MTTFLPEGSGLDTMQQYALAQPLGSALLDSFEANYVPVDADEASPNASPLLGDLTGLLPATIVAPEIGPLVGQGKPYADALETAGVDVVYSLSTDATHEFFGTGAVVDTANDAVAEAAGRPKDAF